MLLVDDQQAESLEADVFLQQPVSADDDVHLASLDAFDSASLSFVVDEP